jgi:hypothetical protein
VPSNQEGWSDAFHVAANYGEVESGCVTDERMDPRRRMTGNPMLTLNRAHLREQHYLITKAARLAIGQTGRLG